MGHRRRMYVTSIAAGVLTAYLAKNKVDAKELPELISDVTDALRGKAKTSPATQAKAAEKEPLGS
jgi:predicted transcriptional regulator